MKQGWYKLRASRCYTLRICASQKTYSVMIPEVNGYIHMQTGKRAENLNKWLQLNWLRFLNAVWFRSSNIKHALVFLRPGLIFTVIKFCSFKHLIGLYTTQTYCGGPILSCRSNRKKHDLFKVIWNISNIAKIIWIKATYIFTACTETSKTITGYTLKELQTMSLYVWSERQ